MLMISESLKSEIHDDSMSNANEYLIILVDL